jgi:magnesium chelatase family protein
MRKAVIRVVHLAQTPPRLHLLKWGTKFVQPVNGDDMTASSGQEHVKHALEVSAAGSHNMMMAGPPGAGKTLIARSMPSILPRLTADEALDITRVYSVADALP